MISWQTAQTLLFLFGPWLLPKMFAFYRRLRTQPPAVIKPLSKRSSYALWILFLSASLAFLSTLPAFAPENIYLMTSSRLQTPASVLLTRLKKIRPLTSFDQRLKTVLDAGGLEAALNYARFGPNVLVDMPFGDPTASAQDYLLYAAPSILAPHLLHMFAVGIATSSQLCGPEGARWRNFAVVAGVLFAAGELSTVYSFDGRENAASGRLTEVNFVHWKIPVWRGLLLATFDALLGWVVWLQATGRAFVTPPTPSERLLEHGRALEGLLQRTRGLGIVRNGALRDPGTRAKMNDFWFKDGEVTRDMLEQPEVLEAQRQVLSRIDLGQTNREMERLVEAMLGGVQIVRP